MAETDYKVIQEKLDKGEDLTPEEMRDVMSEPNTDIANANLSAEDDIPEDEFEQEPAVKVEKKSASAAPAAKPASETPGKATEPPKPAAPVDDVAKLNAELEKPEGEEDLSNLTEREKAYFWEMRRARKRAQTAEEQRDTLRFNEVKRKALEEAKPKEPAKAAEPADPFAGRAEDDVPTIKDLKNLVQTLTPKPAEPAKGQPAAPALDVENPVFQRGLKAMEAEARDLCGEDFDEVMEASPEVISANPANQKAVAEALLRGENIALKMYHLIKGDPEYPKHAPLAKARLAAANKSKPSDGKDPAAAAPIEDPKKKEVLDAQQKLKDNKDKPKTSSSAPASETDAENKIDGYDINELMRMSSREFSKVPRKTRDTFLKKFGS